MLGLRLHRAGITPRETRRWFAVNAKAKTVSRVRGTRDLLADDSQQHRDVLDTLQRTVERYGFRSIQTPLLEYTDLFSRSLGDGSDIVMKEMYTFKDNSGKSVTLRPEGTAGIMRALVSNNLLFSLPQKVSYSGSMFRYERPQRGRYREFQQFGVEFVGSSGPSVDVEVIAMAADALDALGIKDKALLELNSLGDNER
ncbi:Histidine-tRNA ligase [Phytophthora palmivora]|uniref:histidine--tRNA ligase n=1 Tax=Phytophthora palmivora TaxID=4796 RepID=A0A2P4Y0B6_9STRA|nr:Histidine-tRNA ligase [Phytophthora palmivora]